ncbi:Acetyl-CoA hydrolase [Rhodotorula toruloides]|nr:Acetyl-CoA hydrolase [Rhodotorula toruloides]
MKLVVVEAVPLVLFLLETNAANQSSPLCPAQRGSQGSRTARIVPPQARQARGSRPAVQEPRLLWMVWVGYPKETPAALAEHVEKNNLQGKMRFSLFVGASTGPEVEERWARNLMIERRFPHQVGKAISKGINAGEIDFADKHLSMFAQDLTYGYYSRDKKHGEPGKMLDWAWVEATEILPDGSIVPGASVGATPEILASAEKIIVEVNTGLPSMKGLHDIVISQDPPHRLPYLVTHPADRIGTVSIPVDPERVVAIVETNKPDNTGKNAPETEDSKKIAGHLINFFEEEVAAGRMPKNLLPLQSGIGNVANSIIGGLKESKFERMQVWTEVLQDTFLPLLKSGKLDFATATSIRFSPDIFKEFYRDWDDYVDKLLLRPQQVANSPEIIRRLGVIAMNTPLEVDIYAHANSTNALGSRMLNGIGGSADFLRNAKLSIMHTPSARPSKTDPTGISCIVPFATHVDQTEHDLDVIVTEQGLADLRGLSPRQRAPIIIEKCAHPEYREQLLEYYDRSLHECLKKGAAHEPHMLRNAFRMHLNLEEKGTMKLSGWS